MQIFQGIIWNIFKANTVKYKYYMGDSCTLEFEDKLFLIEDKYKERSRGFPTKK